MAITVKKSKFLLFALFVMVAAAGFVAYRAHQKRNSAIESRQHKAFEREEDELTFEAQRRNTVTEIENLQTEDKIKELEGRPRENIIAIAKLEAKLSWEDTLKFEEAQTIKEEELLEKGQPETFAVMQAPDEALIDAIIAARMANATGSEAERTLALANMTAANEKAIAIAEEYEHKLQKEHEAQKP